MLLPATRHLAIVHKCRFPIGTGRVMATLNMAVDTSSVFSHVYSIIYIYFLHHQGRLVECSVLGLGIGDIVPLNRYGMWFDLKICTPPVCGLLKHVAVI